MKSIILLASLLGAMAVSFSGCSSDSNAASTSATQQNNAPVIRTELAKAENVPDVLDLAAKVQADPAKVVHVFPPAGGRVIEVLVRPGDHVRSGQTLAILQSSDVAQARSDYNKAEIEQQRSDNALKRATLLYEHHAIAEKDLLDSQAVQKTDQAELERTRERLHLLGVPVEGTSDELKLVAPRNGVILDLGAAPGEYSKALDAPNPVCTIADIGSIWVLGDVFEKDLASIHTGSPVDISVTAFPSETFHGRIEAVAGAVDPNTRTLKVRVVIPNQDERLKPEMFATIHVTRSDHLAIFLPKTAVLRQGNAASIFVQSSPGKYESRQVTLGRADDGKVEIASGVKPGEAVVVEGTALLEEGNDK